MIKNDLEIGRVERLTFSIGGFRDLSTTLLNHRNKEIASLQAWASQLNAMIMKDFILIGVEIFTGAIKKSSSPSLKVASAPRVHEFLTFLICSLIGLRSIILY